MTYCKVSLNGEEMGRVEGATPASSMYQALIMYDAMSLLFVRYHTNHATLRKYHTPKKKGVEMYVSALEER